MTSRLNHCRRGALLVVLSLLLLPTVTPAQAPVADVETAQSAAADQPRKLQLDTQIGSQGPASKTVKRRSKPRRTKPAAIATTPAVTEAAAPAALVDAAPAPESLPAATDSQISDEATPASATGVGEVLDRVFATHPSIQQALGAVEASRYAIEGARAGYYPYAQVQSAVANKSEDGNTTISIVQPLWDGGLTRAQLEEAKQRREAAFANLTQVRLTLSQEVITAVFDILGADAQLELWDQYISNLQKSRGTIERRAESGVAPDADVQTVLVRISLAESGRETARTQRITARSRLSSLMSQPPPPPPIWSTATSASSRPAARVGWSCSMPSAKHTRAVCKPPTPSAPIGRPICASCYKPRSGTGWACRAISIRSPPPMPKHANPTASFGIV